MCPHIPNPQHGRIEFEDDTTAPFELGTTATYQCELGFGLQGDYYVRTCVMDGLGPDAVWNASAPSCVGESVLIFIIIHDYCLNQTFVGRLS